MDQIDTTRERKLVHIYDKFAFKTSDRTIFFKQANESNLKPKKCTFSKNVPRLFIELSHFTSAKRQQTTKLDYFQIYLECICLFVGGADSESSLTASILQRERA